MDGEMDWIAARFLLSAILGVHPLVALHDDDGAARDDETLIPVDDDGAAAVVMPAVEAAPEEVGACAVCTEEVAAGQAAARLPCAHWYHAGCIAPWLRIRSTCPTCRAELPRQQGGGGGRGGGRAERPPRPASAAVRVAAETETAGGRLRREASYTMLAGTLPS
ncbi:hypothetical protein ACP70R_048487 [Stipagrostis hirtigluma subsp. patula]